MNRRIAAVIAALTFAVSGGMVPTVVAAQDPTPPPSLCGPVAANGDGVVDIGGEENSSGTEQCAVVSGTNEPAWRWLDAAITVYCASPTGSGTNASKDGFYLLGTTRNDAGEITSQGIVGGAWSGCYPNATKTYHLQLVMQGTHRSIALVVERRRWPFSGSGNGVPITETHAYTGTAYVHGSP